MSEKPFIDMTKHELQVALLKALADSRRLDWLNDQGEVDIWMRGRPQPDYMAMVSLTPEEWNHRRVMTVDDHCKKSFEGADLREAIDRAMERDKVCPVCAYDKLTHPPRDFTICPQCGTEFETDDFDFTHSELREKWIAKGRPWFSKSTTPPATGREREGR